MNGKKLERFAKMRTFSSFILTEIATFWFPALLFCHVNIKPFLIKNQEYDMVDIYFL